MSRPRLARAPTCPRRRRMTCVRSFSSPVYSPCDRRSRPGPPSACRARWQHSRGAYPQGARRSVLDAELILLAAGDGERIAARLRAWSPETGGASVMEGSSTSLRDSLLALRPYLDEQPALLAHGGLITQADYADLARPMAADVVSITARGHGMQARAGCAAERICGGRRRAGRRGRAADRSGAVLGRKRPCDGHAAKPRSASMSPPCQACWPPTRAADARARFAERHRTRLLEDFTVIPPVFLHETAVIENAVVGPHVHLEAGAIVRNSVCAIRSSASTRCGLRPCLMAPSWVMARDYAARAQALVRRRRRHAAHMNAAPNWEGRTAEYGVIMKRSSAWKSTPN